MSEATAEPWVPLPADEPWRDWDTDEDEAE